MIKQKLDLNQKQITNFLYNYTQLIENNNDLFLSEG